MMVGLLTIRDKFLKNNLYIVIEYSYVDRLVVSPSCDVGLN